LKQRKRSAHRHCCSGDGCSVPYSVDTSGHCGCFRVEKVEGYERNLIFVGLQPGISFSPVDRDHLLAYVTVANDGPSAVRLSWDGPTPSYEQQSQSALLLPNNSMTVVVSRALEVQYSGEPDQGEEEAWTSDDCKFKFRQADGSVKGEKVTDVLDRLVKVFK
jgi:hypothetical protein